MSHLPLMQISARKLHFWSSNWFGAINLAEETLTEIEFWAGMSILSFGESRSSVRPWHPRDYIKHMSRDDVINTSDAYHMILVYHIQPHDKSFKYSPGNFYRTNFFKLEKLYLNIIWKVKIDWKLCKIKVFVVIFRLIKHMLSIYFEKVIFN